MKKLFFASAFALFGAMNAQESGFEGKTFVMGQIGYNETAQQTELVGDVKVKTFSIAPTIGHFIAPTVAVGAGLGYSSAKVEGDSENLNTFSVTPLVRKYWGVGNNLYIFGQAAIPFSWSKYGDAKVSSIGFQVAPGLDYFITNNWSIEATVGAFGFNSVKPKGGKSTTNTNLGLNLNDIKFGVKYVF